MGVRSVLSICILKPLIFTKRSGKQVVLKWAVGNLILFIKC